MRNAKLTALFATLVLATLGRIASFHSTQDDGALSASVGPPAKACPETSWTHSDPTAFGADSTHSGETQPACFSETSYFAQVTTSAALGAAILGAIGAEIFTDQLGNSTAAFVVPYPAASRARSAQSIDLATSALALGADSSFGTAGHTGVAVSLELAAIASTNRLVDACASATTPTN